MLLSAIAAEAKQTKPAETKHVIGATADFLEQNSGLRFTGRVDTGATTCSIHAENIEVEGGEAKMLKNVGKTIRFDLINKQGERRRVESTIADTVRVKTSNDDGFERRYKVWLTLRHDEVERRVHVTLNDRNHMEYPLLIGRNYLRGRFLVDVAEKHSPLQVAETESEERGDKTPRED